jgi:hypothetical protein
MSPLFSMYSVAKAKVWFENLMQFIKHIDEQHGYASIILCIFYNYINESVVTSHPWERVVSSNQDPYEVPTPKDWCIIHHIHGPNKELLH